ncbi:hypothetical protein BJ742DRAFT_780331 [Cladochytrium replicatum]|nr:hypothetical protein BJ742DRAFT_780331 [Cladochytrium replicatum]
MPVPKTIQGTPTTFFLRANRTRRRLLATVLLVIFTLLLSVVPIEHLHAFLERVCPPTLAGHLLGLAQLAARASKHTRKSLASCAKLLRTRSRASLTTADPEALSAIDTSLAAFDPHHASTPVLANSSPIALALGATHGSAHRYSGVVESATMLLLRLSEDDPSWKAVKGKGKGDSGAVRIWTRPVDGTTGSSALPYIKGAGKIEGVWTVQEVMSVVKSVAAREEWDGRFDGARVLEFLSPSDAVTYTKQKGVFGVSGRDFLSVSRYHFLAGGNEDDGVTLPTAVFVARSVPSDVEERSYVDAVRGDKQFAEDAGKRVRGTIGVWGWKLTGAEGGCNATFVVQADVGGTIPAALVKIIQTQTPLAIKRVNEYLNSSGTVPFILRTGDNNVFGNPEALPWKLDNEWFERRPGRYDIAISVFPDTVSELVRSRRRQLGSAWSSGKVSLPALMIALPARSYAYGAVLGVELTPTEVVATGTKRPVVPPQAKCLAPYLWCSIQSEIVNTESTPELEKLVSSATKAVVRISVAFYFIDEQGVGSGSGSRKLAEVSGFKIGMQFVSRVPKVGTEEAAEASFVVVRDGRPLQVSKSRLIVDAATTEHEVVESEATADITKPCRDQNRADSRVKELEVVEPDDVVPPRDLAGAVVRMERGNNIPTNEVPSRQPSTNDPSTSSSWWPFGSLSNTQPQTPTVTTQVLTSTVRTTMTTTYIMSPEHDVSSGSLFGTSPDDEVIFATTTTVNTMTVIEEEIFEHPLEVEQQPASPPPASQPHTESGSFSFLSYPSALLSYVPRPPSPGWAIDFVRNRIGSAASTVPSLTIAGTEDEPRTPELESPVTQEAATELTVSGGSPIAPVAVPAVFQAALERVDVAWDAVVDLCAGTMLFVIGKKLKPRRDSVDQEGAGSDVSNVLAKGE